MDWQQTLTIVLQDLDFVLRDLNFVLRDLDLTDPLPRGTRTSVSLFVLLLS